VLLSLTRAERASGQRTEAVGVREALVRPVFGGEDCELAHGVEEVALIPDQWPRET
jgi:hypothetical protein